MYEFEVYQCGEGHVNGPRLSPEGDVLEAGMWTFRVNGRESMHYHPTKEHIETIITRVKAGRTKEVSHLRRVTIEPVERTVEIEQMATKDGEPVTIKRTVKKKLWQAKLDGKPCGEPCRNDQEARINAAIEAYLTRGILGQFDAIKAEYARQAGVSPDEVEVHVKNGRVCACCGDKECKVALDQKLVENPDGSIKAINKVILTAPTG